ncbi:hypothetical protein DPMN_121374 [Dreissena polymorpha]|uniref:Uncharacterized protein n=1 Tax=Dreissena polymorpha TaxID=45954 RepID=A0A9D4JR11_DREPO|nr:hypothetical protein DPMN_121374 [Dreissena polymorpha]
MRPAKKNKRSATTTTCNCCENTITKKSRSTPTSPPTPIPPAVPSQEKVASTGPSNAHNSNTVQDIQGGEVNPVPAPPNDFILPIQQPHQQVPVNFSDDSSSEDDVDPPAGLQDILNTHMMGNMQNQSAHR